MSHPRHIVVLGSLNTDLVTVTPRIPVGGETLTAKSFSTGPGGKGLNQAVGCARAAVTAGNDNGIKVIMLGATGTSEDDQLADALHATLKAEGIDGSGIERIPRISSGTATILVEEQSGENRILVVPGANGQVDKSMLESKHFRLRLWGDSKSPKASLLVLQLEVPLDTVVNVISQAKTHDVPVLFNPAPAVTNIPKESLANVDYLVVNETEADILLSNHHKPQNSEIGSDAWLRHVYHSFSELGVTQLIVTLGAKGACYTSSTADGYEFVPAIKVPADKVLDTTAAGDTFVGAYAVELVKYRDEQIDTKRAIERACKAAALAIQKHGAVSSIPLGTEY